MTTEIKRSALIPAPVDEVWRFLADFESIGRWAPTVDHSSAASRDLDTLGRVRRVQLGRVTLLETVTSWVPEQQLAYSISGLPPMAGSVVTTWQLAARGQGTQTSMSTVIDPVPGPPGRVISRVLGRRMASAAEEMLAGLASYIASHQETR